MKKRAEFRELLRELRQTRFGMRLGGAQEGGATKQEKQKERMDEWEERDVEETVEETVEPVVYQPNCMRCDEWGVGVDCIGSGDARRVISREIICSACGAIAPGLKQRISEGRRALARKMRISAKDLDEATDILDIEDIGEKYWTCRMGWLEDPQDARAHLTATTTSSTSIGRTCLMWCLRRQWRPKNIRTRTWSSIQLNSVTRRRNGWTRSARVSELSRLCRTQAFLGQ